MKCPHFEHFGMGPELRDSGWGEIKECPVCHRYFTKNGVEVLKRDLARHNSDDWNTDIEWTEEEIQDLYAGVWMKDGRSY